jgi:hypothetical protein
MIWSPLLESDHHDQSLSVWSSGDWNHCSETSNQTGAGEIWITGTGMVTVMHLWLGSLYTWHWLAFFLIGIVGGGVQLGQLYTAATNRPIVPALGDYDDEEIGGMMIGRGNLSIWRKLAPVPLCPPQAPHACPARTWATAVGSQWLTTWTTEQPSGLWLH